VQALLPIVCIIVAVQLIVMTPFLANGGIRVQSAIIAMFLLFVAVMLVPTITMLAFAALGMSVAAVATTLEPSS
jgi:hypothetical protein